MTDPFDVFKKRTTPKPEIVVNRQETRPVYVAFNAKDKVLRLDVRCREDGVTHAIAYQYMHHIGYNRKTYSELFFTASGLRVTITGSNLKSVIEALKLEKCEFIEEFDPDTYAKPNDDTAPFIEHIKVDILRG